MSFDINELKNINSVEYNLADENMISADYKITEGKNSVKYQVMFYVGGSNGAELYKVNKAGDQIEGTLTAYICGIYDDGNDGAPLQR